MTTINQIVEDSFRPFGEPQEGDFLSAHQATRGLALFNQMMHEMPVRGIEFTDGNGTAITHSDMSGGDPLPIPDKFRNSLSLTLSRYIADEFGYTIAPSLLVRMNHAFMVLFRNFQSKKETNLETVLCGGRFY